MQIVRSDGNIEYRFLIHADFERHPTQVVSDDAPIWIRDPDGTITSLTYAEFREASKALEAKRPLPDGRIELDD